MLNSFSEIVMESVASHKYDYIFQNAASMVVGQLNSSNWKYERSIFMVTTCKETGKQWNKNRDWQEK